MNFSLGNDTTKHSYFVLNIITISLNNYIISTLFHADDQIVHGDSEYNLQRPTFQLETISRKYGEYKNFSRFFLTFGNQYTIRE